MSVAGEDVVVSITGGSTRLFMTASSRGDRDCVCVREREGVCVKDSTRGSRRDSATVSDLRTQTLQE